MDWGVAIGRPLELGAGPGDELVDAVPGLPGDVPGVIATPARGTNGGPGPINAADGGTNGAPRPIGTVAAATNGAA